MAGIQPLESIERLVKILAAINAAKGINITDLASDAALSRAAVNRYVISLVDLGYVYRDARTRTYRPTAKTHELSRGVNREEALKATVLPAMQKVCKEVGWPLNFSRIKNSQLTLIANTDDISPLVTKRRENLLMRPLIGRAGGHVLLAHLPTSVKDDLLTVALQQDPNLFKRAHIEQEAFDQSLTIVRQQGYAVEAVPDRRLNSMAVPVTVRGTVPFSLSTGVDDAVLPIEALAPRLLEPLKICAVEIGQRLATIDTDRWLGNEATPHMHTDTREDQP